MHLFRIANCKHILDMSGSGGLYSSGRWHEKGTRIIYFSEHVSLAKLEVLANAGFIPKGLCLLTVDIPDKIGIEEVSTEQLPEDWDAYPYPEILTRFTKRWLNSGKTSILKVPSAQSCHEFNYLINPGHPDIKKFSIVSTEEINFDQRLSLSND